VPANDRRTEEEIFGRFRLTPAQTSRLNALVVEVDAEATKICLSGVFDPAREEALTRKWTEGLRGILTPAQFRRYAEYWADGPMAAVPVRAAGPAAPAAPGRVGGG
jgi:hypothetical protein